MYSIMKWQVKFREYISGLNLLQDDYRGIMEYIDEVPTIRPRGQWLPDGIDYYEGLFVCSVCGRSYKVDTCMGEPTWDFCPGCGADMREEEQDD